jgi:hypothetical protein
MQSAGAGRTKDQGPRTKDQGARTKDQGPRTKDQGPRTKDQGPRAKDQGPRAKGQGMPQNPSFKAPHQVVNGEPAADCRLGWAFESRGLACPGSLAFEPRPFHWGFGTDNAGDTAGLTHQTVKYAGLIHPNLRQVGHWGANRRRNGKGMRARE